MNKKITPQVEAALVTLADAGKLTPANVVKAGEDPTSPLHGFFTWDDEAAAEKHRLNEARDLIRAVKIRVEYTDRMVTAPCYVHDPRAIGQGYVSLTSLKSDTDVARAAVQAELRRAYGCLERANRVADVLGLSGEIENLISLTRAVIEPLEEASQ